MSRRKGENDPMIDFKICFEALTGYPPFHWQEKLFTRMRDGYIPRECDVPTGLGKTSVITIWLLALGENLPGPACERKVPLRLVYVVDRRVVVDQSTDEAVTVTGKLAQALHLTDNPLTPIAQAFCNAAFVTDDSLVAL